MPSINTHLNRIVTESGASTLRLQTIVRLRWIAVFGQLVAIAFVSLGLGFELPVGYCMTVIALSAWLNVYLQVRYSASHRLSLSFASVLLAYDIFQLAALLYLTGGIANPFTMLIVAPVTVSAATLPLRNTMALGVMAIAVTALLVTNYMPLPWFSELRFELPLFYKLGILAAVAANITFLALYAWRLATEGNAMTAALAATEAILAREQRLHALDGLAAAAAHELGTPLSTITLITKEMEQDSRLPEAFGDDVRLLREQALRCREILRKLTKTPGAQDPMHARWSIRELLTEAAEPYSGGNISIDVDIAPTAAETKEPDGLRLPGVIYGLGNIIENASDFAQSQVKVKARWDAHTVLVEIIDDGPGFSPEIMDSLGEPYVTTRAAGSHKPGGEASGLGLGFFIAKTLLERSGADLSLSNRPDPERGAVVRISWPREAFLHGPAA